MKHLILGTAGHVDHGKTALIQALTGIDCDTHEEEKRRGVTIHLGFSHLDLGDGERIGVVDVPGHRDFVHTMVGGASGIDIVMLVVAADSGIMPQTREHLQIMQMLGLSCGLVALTRVDLVEDREMISLAQEEVAEFVEGTFLEGAPVVEVSAKTGEGLDALRRELTRLAHETPERSSEGVFRMHVDRIFSKSGFGTIVTGSVSSGSIGVEDKVYLLPDGKKELRVRQLQRHGESVDKVVAGDRASVNLVGLDKSEFRRGMLISDHPLSGKNMVDARLELFYPEARLGIWSQVLFHSGTWENPARMHLIDKNRLGAKERALVQIHFAEPCVLSRGDRFVIRNSSSDTTLGGGEVIDVSPLHHRKRPERLIEQMGAQAKGNLRETIAFQVRKFHRAVYADEIAEALNVSGGEVAAQLDKKLSAEIIRFRDRDRLILIPREVGDALRNRILEALGQFREDNPFLERGANFDEIRGALKLEEESASARYLQRLLTSLVAKGKIEERSKTWRIVGGGDGEASHNEAVSAIEQYLIGQKMSTPILDDLKTICSERNLTVKDLRQILSGLVAAKKAYSIQGEYIHSSVVDSCREKLVQELESTGAGMTVAAFRNLVGGNRKICLLLFAIFDGERITKREGDVRVLTRRR